MEAEVRNYTGITIGPIYETMMLASSPASFWYASYLYSWIAKHIIQSIIEQLIEQGDTLLEQRFIAPFFSVKRCLEGRVEIRLSDDDDIVSTMHEKGVGLFHDRIIFCSDGLEESLDLVEKAKEAVIEQYVKEEYGSEDASSGDENNTRLQEIIEWFKHFLRIYSVNVDVAADESPFIYLGQILSAIELEPHFKTVEKHNFILSKFHNENGNGKGKNEALKESLLVRQLKGDWLLFDSHSDNTDKPKIMDLETIASAAVKDSQRKYTRYYAVLQADGDNMSKILARLRQTEELRGYSKKCLRFCAEAAELIKAYGGVMIYAGGDDILALLPVIGYDPKEKTSCSIMRLIESIRKKFNVVFQDEKRNLGGAPTISFGVAIQHYKSPLYEAMNRAKDMLDLAKSGQKNAAYFDIQKHSGQSLLIWDEQMDLQQKNLLALLDDISVISKKDRTETSAGNDDDPTVLFLASVGKQIERHAHLFAQTLLDVDPIIRDKMVANLFNNLFDSSAQSEFREYLLKLQPLVLQCINKYYEWKKRAEESSIDKKAVEEAKEAQIERTMHLIQSSVRFLHFLKEKGE